MAKSRLTFDVRRLIEKAKKLPAKADGITISLPLISVTMKPDRVERDVAREIVIRLANKRVLNAWECCDDCIDNAMASVVEIRSFLVDMQVSLKDKTDTALYLVIEFMLEGVRQFLTYAEGLQRSRHKQAYFDALNVLRPHLYRCLTQVAVVADMKVPQIPENMRFDLSWNEQHYLATGKSIQILEKNPMGKVIQFPRPAEPKSIQVTGDGNVVAGGDIKVDSINVTVRKTQGKATTKGLVLPGSVATDPDMMRYLKYLVKRYHTFKEAAVNRSGEKTQYFRIYKAFQSKFRFELKDTPLERFGEATEYLQYRIENTALGRNLKKRQRLYRIYEEFLELGPEDE